MERINQNTTTSRTNWQINRNTFALLVIFGSTWKVVWYRVYRGFEFCGLAPVEHVLAPLAPSQLACVICKLMCLNTNHQISWKLPFLAFSSQLWVGHRLERQVSARTRIVVPAIPMPNEDRWLAAVALCIFNSRLWRRHPIKNNKYIL